MPAELQAMSAAAYEAAKRNLIDQPDTLTAPAAPVSAADRPDWQCVDVRPLPESEYQNQKAEYLGRWS